MRVGLKDVNASTCQLDHAAVARGQREANSAGARYTRHKRTRVESRYFRFEFFHAEILTRELSASQKCVRIREMP